MSRFTCIRCGASTTGQYWTEESFNEMLAKLRGHLVAKHQEVYAMGVGELLDCFYERDDSGEQTNTEVKNK